MNDPRVEALLAFWFGEERDDARMAEEREALWFGGSEADDRRITARFARRLREGEAGALDAWAETPRGCLALIVLLDQFSRVIGRGERRAFANDAKALAWARHCIDSGAIDSLRPIERVFVFLPLEHTESLEAQQESVARYTALAAEVPAAWRERFEGIADFARRHEAVIRRFGRFPRRNEVLGRTSTREEADYLRDHVSVF